MSPTRPLRFAFVSTMNGAPWGGSEQLWSETALRLRQLGHEVHASVLQWPVRPEAVAELRRRDVRVAFRPRRRHLFGRFVQKGLFRIWPGPIEVNQRWWLRRTEADLVVISQGGPWDGLSWMLASRTLGRPYCSVIQANSELWWPLDDWLDRIHDAVADAERIFFVSDANRRLMELQCGRSVPNAEVIANPCKVSRDGTVAWPAATTPVRFACVARMSPEAKGQDVLFGVLAQPKWRHRPVELHLYGTGPCEQSLRAIPPFLGLTNVFFHGHTANIRDTWMANHVLVLPSRFEGLPLTIQEAMLCGRPVITTRVAGAPEIVDDNVNGFLAGAATPPLLDEAMERAWQRRDEWPAMGRRGREDMLAAMPEDPVGVFAGKLLDLAQRRRAGHEPAVERENSRPVAQSASLQTAQPAESPPS